MSQCELNAFEQAIVKRLVKLKYERNRSDNVANARRSEESDFEIDVQGTGAEIAFCKLFNVYPDLQYEERKEADARMKTGETVDVKTTKRINGRLLAVPWKKVGDVDIYALMIGDFPTYLLIGFATSDDLIKSENVVNLGRGECYSLVQDSLYSYEMARQKLDDKERK